MLNTGPSTHHRIISPRSHDFPDCCALLVAASNHVTCISFCRSDGNRRKSQNTTRIQADILVSVSGRTPNDCTIRCKISVKIIIEIANDSMITRGRDFFHQITDHHTITGRIGSTHGASTVRIQATNERRRIHMTGREK